MKYSLTDEGRKYLKEGLPEKKLLDLLEKGPARIADAQRKVDNFSIALQWAKKKGWVTVVRDGLELVNVPEYLPEEEALKDIAEEKELSSDIISVLLQRKLVREEREDIMKQAEKFVGKEITSLTPELIKTGLWRKANIRPYNVSAVGKKIYPGKRHPYQQFISLVKKRLVELGFKEMKGTSVETEFWNFDALYQPQNHPARDWAQTYSLSYPKCGTLPGISGKVKSAHENGVAGGRGWNYKWDPRKAMQLMPRAHGTCLSARTLAGKPDIPGKYFAVARCYRPDVLDATHLIEFNHVEGIVIDESLSFRSLLGILEIFAKEIAGAKKIRYLPDYYPFTEPSCQLSAYHEKIGWMELGAREYSAKS